jgi:hypothetical protein
MIRLLFCMLLPVVVQTQTLLPDECCGGVIRRSEHYAGRALSGYMDGGAELYHEYGFVALSVQEIVMPGGEEITAEIFHMSTPRAAYGIYSISRHGCTGADSSLLYVCEGPYQAQGLAGKYYIRIQSSTDTHTATDLRLKLLRTLIFKLGQEKVTLSPVFAGHTDVGLMSGPLGVQNGMPDLEELLEGSKGYIIQSRWLDNDRGLLAEAEFQRAEDAGVFASLVGIPITIDVARELPSRPGWWILWTSPLTVRILHAATPGEVPEHILRGQTDHER